MRRSRVKSALLGLVILLVNVSIVVAVVSLTGGRRGGGLELPPSAGGKGKTVTGTPSVPATAGATSGVPAEQLAAKAAAVVGLPKPVNVAVLGDGTGDEEGEWVQVLATLLGKTRTVGLRNLNTSDPTIYDEAVTYGTSGPKATVWNGSRQGASAAYAARRLDLLVPTTPDVVLLSYGRSNTATNIPTGLTSTYTAIRAKWPSVPVLVVLQAPNRDDVIGPVRVAAEDWATQHHVPTVDVAGAFTAAGDPNRYVSVVDPPSTNSKGGRLWARTAYAALGGDVSDLPADGFLPGGGPSTLPTTPETTTETTTGG